MNVGIIGQGRFGTLLKKILAPHFNVNTCDTSIDPEVLHAETLFIAAPIRHFESIIKKISPHLGANTTVMDVCSVKVFPCKVMKQFLPSHVDIIATHPLFGPDSYSTNHQKKIMLAKIRDQYLRFDLWKNFFKKQHIEPIEMTPERHDRYMAESQNITHLLGRALNAMSIKSTPINTAGFNQLLKIVQQTCNDSEELFYDLQRYNPYSKAINEKLIAAITQNIPKFD